MKKRLALILSGAAAAGMLSLAPPSGWAQTTNQVPPTGIPPAPGTPGLPASPAAPQAIPGRPAPPQFNNRPGALPPRRMMPAAMALRNAVRSLEMAKRELTTATTDYDGHRQPALEACEKAITELNEALKHVPPPPPPPVAAPRTNAAPGAPPTSAPVPPPAPK